MTEEKTTAATKAAADPNYADYHTRYADFEAKYLTDHIQLADTKASLCGAVLLALISMFVKELNAILDAAPSPHKFFGYYTIMMASVSAWYIYSVIAPRISKNAEGIIYWRSILQSHEDADEFAFVIKNLSANAVMNERLKHCYALAYVCTRKYEALKLSMNLGAIAIFSAIMYYAAHAIQ